MRKLPITVLLATAASAPAHAVRGAVQTLLDTEPGGERRSATSRWIEAKQKGS